MRQILNGFQKLFNTAQESSVFAFVVTAFPEQERPRTGLMPPSSKLRSVIDMKIAHFCHSLRTRGSSAFLFFIRQPPHSPLSGGWPSPLPPEKGGQGGSGIQRPPFHPLGCRRHACMEDWYEKNLLAPSPHRGRGLGKPESRPTGALGRLHSGGQLISQQELLSTPVRALPPALRRVITMPGSEWFRKRMISTTLTSRISASVTC